MSKTVRLRREYDAHIPERLLRYQKTQRFNIQYARMNIHELELNFELDQYTNPIHFDEPYNIHDTSWNE